MSIAIVTGPPGAGKTSIAAQLAQSRPLAVHVVADQVFHWIVAGYVPPWMPGTGPQNGTVISAIAAAAAQFDDCGYDVFVDGIIGPWFLPQWLTTADAGESLQYLILRPAREVARARATGRRDLHDLVDADPVEKMFDVFEDLGSFEAHVLDSSRQDFSATLAAANDGLRQGRYLLTPRSSADMDRLAAKFRIDPPTPD